MGDVMQSDLETLHRLRGSVDVARNMIGRSADLCARRDGSVGSRVVAGLIDVAESLAAVSLAIEDELQKRAMLGPAA